MVILRRCWLAAMVSMVALTATLAQAAPATTGEPSPSVRPTTAPPTPPPPPPARTTGPDTGPPTDTSPGDTGPAPRATPARSRDTAPPPRARACPAAKPCPPAGGGKAYATRGVFELGGDFELSYQRDHINLVDWLSIGMDLYGGYFIADHFTLGLYMAFSYSRSKVDAGGVGWSVRPGLLLAPGGALRLGKRLFLFGDLLGGVYFQRSFAEDELVYGAVGAELGLKLLVGRSYLVRFSMRPIYFTGKHRVSTTGVKDDIGWFTLFFRVGFSGLF